MLYRICQLLLAFHLQFQHCSSSPHCSRANWKDWRRMKLERTKTRFHHSHNSSPPWSGTTFLCRGGCVRDWRQAWQWFRETSKLFPVSAFYRKLSAVERNNDIGNQEPTSCETCSGEMETLAGHLFIVFTNHKNLEYLCSVKCLNAHQAPWSLFFTTFNFTPVPRTERQTLFRLSSPVSKENLKAYYLLPAFSMPSRGT